MTCPWQTIVRLEVGEAGEGSLFAELIKVLVYPQPGKKPEVGVGLNKAATVTMYQCWPPNGSILAQEPQKFSRLFFAALEDKEQQEEYKRRIKVMTEEKKARLYRLSRRLSVEWSCWEVHRLRLHHWCLEVCRRALLRP